MESVRVTYGWVTTSTQDPRTSRRTYMGCGVSTLLAGLKDWHLVAYARTMMSDRSFHLPGGPSCVFRLRRTRTRGRRVPSGGAAEKGWESGWGPGRQTDSGRTNRGVCRPDTIPHRVRCGRNVTDGPGDRRDRPLVPPGPPTPTRRTGPDHRGPPGTRLP